MVRNHSTIANSSTARGESKQDACIHQSTPVMVAFDRTLGSLLRVMLRLFLGLAGLGVVRLFLGLAGLRVVLRLALGLAGLRVVLRLLLGLTIRRVVLRLLLGLVFAVKTSAPKYEHIRLHFPSSGTRDVR